MEKKPQVFINFRGKDERMKLVSHLKHHLSNNINVNVFTDEDAVGEPLENLYKHIRKSKIVIVIFSISYLESRWCLDELVEIKKCLETEKIDFAIPIFYKVKASNVKKQSGVFGKKFLSLRKNNHNSRVQKWKKALKSVAAIIGLTYSKKRYDFDTDLLFLYISPLSLSSCFFSLPSFLLFLSLVFFFPLSSLVFLFLSLLFFFSAFHCSLLSLVTSFF